MKYIILGMGTQGDTIGRVISFYLERYAGWVRILGIGFSYKNFEVNNLTFSERCGHRSGLRLGSWIFHLLH